MAAFTTYAQNRIGDATFRAQALGAPTTSWYLGLHNITGVWLASTAYTVGQYAVPTTSNGRLYRVTTAGTSGATQPTWPTTAGGTVTDGTVVWTEQTTALVGGTNPTEVTATGYGRATLAASLGGLAGSQGAASTTASTGQAGFSTSNNTVVTWSAPTANWGTTGLVTWADAPTVFLTAAITTASTSLTLTAALTVGPSSLVQVGSELMTVTAGSGTTTLTVTRAAAGTTAQAASSGAPVSGAIWAYEVMTNPQAISSGASAPTAAAGALTLAFNNTL